MNHQKNQGPLWNAIMDQSVTPDWDSGVTVSQTNIDFLTKTTIFNLTPDETNAGWFIIVVIGFFAVIIVSSMVINQIYSEPEEDLLIDFLNNESSKKRKSVKIFKKKSLDYVNQGFSETTTSNQDSKYKELMIKPEKKETNIKTSATGPNEVSEAVICISTVS